MATRRITVLVIQDFLSQREISRVHGCGGDTVITEFTVRCTDGNIYTCRQTVITTAGSKRQFPSGFHTFVRQS